MTYGLADGGAESASGRPLHEHVRFLWRQRPYWTGKNATPSGSQGAGLVANVAARVKDLL